MRILILFTFLITNAFGNEGSATQSMATNLKSFSFFDIYFDSISLEKLNLGVRVEFQSEERTLTTQEVDQQMKQLIENLKQDFNVEI